MYTSIKLPTVLDGKVILNGIEEPDIMSSIDKKIRLITYKVGNINEHYLKEEVFGGSPVQRKEMINNVGEAICHLLTLSILLDQDVTELIDESWKKIGDNFVNFKKSGLWIDRVTTKNL